MQVLGGIAQGVLLRILVGSDTERVVADPRVASEVEGKTFGLKVE